MMEMIEKKNKTMQREDKGQNVKMVKGTEGDDKIKGGNERGQREKMIKGKRWRSVR